MAKHKPTRGYAYRFLTDIGYTLQANETSVEGMDEIVVLKNGVIVDRSSFYTWIVGYGDEMDDIENYLRDKITAKQNTN